MENIRICKRIVNVLDRACGVSLYLLGVIFTTVYAWRWFGPMGSTIPTITVGGAVFCWVCIMVFGYVAFFILLFFMTTEAKWRASKLGLFFVMLSKEFSPFFVTFGKNLGQSVKNFAISASSN